MKAGGAGSRPVSARDIARDVLVRVEQGGAFAGRTLNAALDRTRDLAPEDRGLATEIVYGVLRRRVRLDRALEPLASRGLAALDPRVHIALRVGAYQILFLTRVPAYAAVDDAVEACKRLGGRGVAGFANAVLRRLAGAGEPPLPEATTDPLGYLTTACGLPPWLAELVLAERPAEAIAFGASVSEPAPVTLRTNTTRITRGELAVRLTVERPDVVMTPSAVAPDAIEARRLDAPAATACYRDGLFAIQDAGAQLVAELCGVSPGERILDACAGVGGKTALLLALSGGGGRVDALDVDPSKLDEARETVRRLGLTGATFATADLTRPLADASPRYDRILLDAPCSGLGVLRRHPELLLRRTAADLATFADRQLAMLGVLAPALVPSGLLTYAVCTFDRRECEDVVAGFLRAHPEFEIEPAPAADARVDWARVAEPSGAIRTWPHRDGADGFFAVRLRRSAR